MKRRSFLGLLGGAVVAPFAKADEPPPGEDIWKFDVYQTPFLQQNPAFDCYVSDFGAMRVVKFMPDERHLAGRLIACPKESFDAAATRYLAGKRVCWLK